jgi:hypothetical protein
MLETIEPLGSNRDLSSNNGGFSSAKVEIFHQQTDGLQYNTWVKPDIPDRIPSPT